MLVPGVGLIPITFWDTWDNTLAVSTCTDQLSAVVMDTIPASRIQHSFVTFKIPNLQWGTVGTEIKIPSVENSEQTYNYILPLNLEQGRM